MSDEFKKCLRSKKIVKFPRAKKKTGIELKAAAEDLKNAKKFFKDKNLNTPPSPAIIRSSTQPGRFCIHEAIEKEAIIA